MKKYSTLFFALLVIQLGHAQDSSAWHGKKCAVVLTYDDAIDQHLDNAVPVLDSLGLKATFYITAYSSSTQKRLNEWKALTTKGHELGNHTLYHPCIGGAGREWVRPEYDLSNYSVQRIVDEIKMTNTFLQSLDGKNERTFAFTCADTKAGGVDFSKEIRPNFVALRNVRNEMHTIDKVNLADVDCYMVNNHTAAQLKEWVDKAIASNALLVILFHGVGGGNGLDVSLDAHRELLSYIKKKEKEIWVAPMVEVANHVKKWQESH